MSEAFLAWYDKTYPESNWQVDDLGVYDSWYEYLSRNEHKRMMYKAWCAALESRIAQSQEA